MKKSNMTKDDALLISGKDLPNVFQNVSANSDEEGSRKSFSGTRLTAFNSGEWWIGLDSGTQLGCPETRIDHRVETSGLHELQGIAETLHEEHESTVREDEDISSEVQIPATILPQVEQSSGSHHVLIVAVLAAAVGCLAGVLLSATMGLSIQGRTKHEGSPGMEQPAGEFRPESNQMKMSANADPNSLESVPAENRNRKMVAASEPGSIDFANGDLQESGAEGPDESPSGDDDMGESRLDDYEAGNETNRRSGRRRRRRHEGHDSEDPDENLDIVALALKSGPGHAVAASPAAPAAPEPNKLDSAETVSKMVVQEAPRKTTGKSESKELVEHMLGGISREESAKNKQPRKKQDSDKERNLPLQLDRSSIAQTMRGHNSRVNQCLRKFGLFHQKIQARVVVRGSSGEVVSAEVVGNYRGAPVAACMQLELRKARFPVFRQNRQQITLTFVIREQR